MSSCGEFGLGGMPSPFPDNWLKHLIQHNDFYLSDCIDNVHNGTSLASIGVDSSRCKAVSHDALPPANRRGTH
jgi:hypothetical protein